MNINSRTSKINFTGFASGAIASFTGRRAAPIKVAAQIVPIQSGSGDPAPDNIRPISGASECNVVRCGKNLFNPLTQFNVISFYLVANNVLPNTECIMSFVDKDTSVDISNVSFGFLESGHVGGAPQQGHFRWVISNGVIQSNKTNATALMNCTSLFVYPQNQSAIDALLQRFDIQIELGSTATAYEAYTGNTYTIQLGDTYYGGSLYVTNGVLTVTHANIASYNGEPINEPWICSEAVYSEGTTPPIGSQVVYPLATPVNIQLTPTQIEQLLGTNNIYADTGNVKVFYVTV